jgi:hypothetical protein
MTDAPKPSIVEEARKELLETLNDLIDRYDYETVRDVLFQLKPNVTVNTDTEIVVDRWMR